jgi:hypothetical protein
MVPQDEPKEEVVAGQTPTVSSTANQAAKRKDMPKAEEQPPINSVPVKEAAIGQTPTAPGVANQAAERKDVPKAEEQLPINSVPV